MATPSTARSSQRSETGIAIVVYGGFVLTGVMTTLLGPMLPTLSSQWSLTDVQAGRLFTAQFLGSILGVGFTSWLLPRCGYRVVLGAGYFLMAAGVGVLGLGGMLWGTLCVFAYGMGQGLTIPASNLLVADWNPHRRAAALNLLNFAWGAGAVICPFFIAAANRTHDVWGWLVGLAAALAAAALGVSLASSMPSQSGNDSPAKTAGSGTWTKMFACALGLLFFLYVGTETALGGWVASHAKRTASPNSQMWVYTPSVFWGALVLGRALAPLFLNWLQERKLALLDLVVATAGVMILLSAGSVAGVSVGSGIVGFGLSSIFPINVALLSYFGPLASRAAGPMFALAGVGGAIIPWLVGFTATRFESLRVALLLPLVAILLMLALHGWNSVWPEEKALDGAAG